MSGAIQAFSDYHRHQDDMVDSAEAWRESHRQQPTNPNELPGLVEEWYRKFVSQITLLCGGNNYICLGPKKDAPIQHDVVQGVIAKLKEKGFEAKHIYSDGRNRTDMLRIVPPKNWVEKLF